MTQLNVSLNDQVHSLANLFSPKVPIQALLIFIVRMIKFVPIRVDMRAIKMTRWSVRVNDLSSQYLVPFIAFAN